MRLSVPPMFRALRHRNYRLWAAADLVSVTGSWMQNLALNWLVLERTGSATAVGVSVLLQTLPTLLLAPWAGALADRLPTRRMILGTQTLHALLALTLASAAAVHASLAVIYVIAVLGGLVSVVEGPALGRFNGQVVPRTDLSNALALGSVINSVGRILGMGAAGVLIAVTSEPVLFALNATSFVAVIAALVAVREQELYPLAVSTAQRAGVRAGLRYLRSSRHLLVLFGFAFVLSSLGRNYQVTMAAMSNGPLAAGASGYGMLSAVFAAGTVLGGLYAAQRRELTLALLLGAAGLTSVLQTVSGLTGSVLAFAAVLVPIAAGAVVLDTAMGARVQLGSDEDMRGRVLAAHSMVAAASGAVGGPLLGWLCEWIGPDRTLQLAGVVTTVATLVTAMLLTGRSGVSRQDTYRPHLVSGTAGQPVSSAVGTPVVAGHTRRAPARSHPSRGHGRRLSRPGLRAPTRRN